MITTLKRLIKFITHDIWAIDAERGKWYNILIDEIKIFMITFKNYGGHLIAVRSAALTFYTLISIVPVTAMILGISKGFGLDDEILNFIKVSFSQYDIVIEKISEFANAFLDNSKIGLFAGVSVIVLLWSVFMVFFNIEEAFNYIWEIKGSRPISRRLTNYLSIVITLPVLYSISSSVKNFITSEIVQVISDSIFLQHVYSYAFWIIYLIIVWLLFASIYILLPNTKVKFTAAFHAGIIVGSAYLIIQYAYIYFQTSVSSYSIIYGSFAALPLLLLWINICWQVMLFGAELSFAYQNIDKYEYERISSKFSNRFRQRLMVLIVRELTQNFAKSYRPLSSQDIADKTNIPVGAVRDIMYQLLAADVVFQVDNHQQKETKENYYTIGIDISTLTIGKLLDIVGTAGTNDLKSVDELSKVDNLFNKLDLLIKDI